jgi:hypothetical protein
MFLFLLGQQKNQVILNEHLIINGGHANFFVSKTVKTVKIFIFQFFGNNFNIDEWYYDDTCKPLTGGRNA